MTTNARLDGTPAQLWGSGYGDVAGRLLTAGVRCFAVSGFHGTTTRDIAKAAGLSSAALYVHFQSKEHLLFEITKVAHRRSLEGLTSGGLEGTPTERLRTLVERFVSWHARNHVAARVAQYELGVLEPEHYQEIALVRRAITEIFRSTIEDGIAQGEFVESDVGRTVRAILSLGIDLVRWYDLDGRDTPQTLGDVYADHALAIVRCASR